MTSRYEMRSPFSTKEQINLWAKRYTDGQTGAQRVVEKYLMGLKKTVRERKTHRTSSGYLRYNELYDLVYWKLKRSRWVDKNKESFVRKITGEVFCLDDDSEKLNRLTDLWGVGQSVASAILHLCDQEKYPILDQHALRSLAIDDKYLYGPKYPFWQKYVKFCRAVAKQYNVSMRTLDRALWKYSIVSDIRVNKGLRLHRYPPTGGPLGVTVPREKPPLYDAKQFRRQYGSDTFVEVIEEIGVEKVKSLNIKYGDNSLIYERGDFTKIYGYVRYIESGAYQIRVPGPIYVQVNLLKEVAERLNIDLIIDDFE